MDMQSVGRLVVFMGIFIVALGALIMLVGRFSSFGRLPGDFQFSWSNGTVYFPLATSLVLSVVLTLVVNVVLRLLNRQ